MPKKVNFTIPGAELPLVEAHLGKFAGLRMVGTNSYRLDGRDYADLFMEVEQPEQLYQLGSLVSRALEQQEAQRLAYPAQLDAPLRFVLGRPNFWCGPYAHLFRAAGHTIEPRAEHEQAFVLHWLTKLVLLHGDEWTIYAQQEAKALAAQVAQQQKGGVAA